ncbi:5-oxoprolinase subunit PxpB [Paenibacillus harenae]|uniref:5-oxoprolinase subunit PxpB n=1 Tax=Paenibacillus harenae TaxID=306543 RepID=UPI00041EA50E|nr:5-oxoprolinase subunit PxpB [Paenibacillus harenae]
MINGERGGHGDYELFPLGDCAVLIRFGVVMDEALNRIVHAFAAQLEEKPFAGMIECTPAFASVTVHYDPLAVMRSRTQAESTHSTIYETVSLRLRLYLPTLEPSDMQTERTVVEIPVCYGEEYGPDLAFVAEHNGLTEEEVVAIHSGSSYLVYMIGFAPGFPYLGGMPERIAAPRHKTPRTVIPAGSVGIAGNQTGVYSVATPGGWQLIGRTPLQLFRPGQTPPSLLQAGAEVRFQPIARAEFENYGRDA